MHDCWEPLNAAGSVRSFLPLSRPFISDLVREVFPATDSLCQCCSIVWSRLLHTGCFQLLRSLLNYLPFLHSFCIPIFPSGSILQGSEVTLVASELQPPTFEIRASSPSNLRRHLTYSPQQRETKPIRSCPLQFRQTLKHWIPKPDSSSTSVSSKPWATIARLHPVPNPP